LRGCHGGVREELAAQLTLRPNKKMEPAGNGGVAFGDPSFSCPDKRGSIEPRQGALEVLGGVPDSE